MIERFERFNYGNGRPGHIQEQIQVGGPLLKPNTLSPEVETILNEGLGEEYKAYFFYRNATNWCKGVNYAKAAAFFDGEAAADSAWKMIK